MVLRSLFCLLFLASCSSTTTEVEKEVPKPLTKDEGSQLYQMRCTACHGDDGQLELAGAKDLSKSTLSKNEIIQTISEGKGAMPAFGPVLNQFEKEALAQKVNSLRK